MQNLHLKYNFHDVNYAWFQLYKQGTEGIVESQRAHMNNQVGEDTCEGLIGLRIYQPPRYHVSIEYIVLYALDLR